MMYLLKSNEELTQQYQAIMGRTLIDRPFRNRLMANPHLVITTETQVEPHNIEALVAVLEQIRLDEWTDRVAAVKVGPGGWY